MKKSYPNYPEGMDAVRKSISAKDRHIIEEFLKSCRKTASDRSIAVIEAQLIQVYDVIGKPINKWTKADLDEYTALLNNSNRSEWTKHGLMAVAKRFVKWHYKDIDMIENVKRKQNKQLFNYKKINDSTLLTPEEVERLIRATDTLRMKAFIMLLYESGARPEEIRTLRWKDVKFYDGHAEINIFARKTDTCRTIPIKESAVHLKRWQQEYCLPNVRQDYLIFPGKVNAFYDPYKVMSQTVLSRFFRHLGEKAKINKKVYPYIFRHTRLTALYSQLPEHIVKKFAGHSPNSDMPGVYSHISNKDVKDAMLEKIYHVEELSSEQKSKMQQEIDDLRSKLQWVMSNMGSGKPIVLKKKIEKGDPQYADEMEGIEKVTVYGPRHRKEDYEE